MDALTFAMWAAQTAPQNLLIWDLRCVLCVQLSVANKIIGRRVLTAIAFLHFLVGGGCRRHQQAHAELAFSCQVSVACQES